MNAKTVSNANDPMESAASAVGHLYEAKERLKDAAVAAGSAVKQAASSAATAAREPLSDAAAAASAAAGDAKAAATAEFDIVLDKGKELWNSAEELIRKRPVAAFGAAFAVGWLIAKLVRRH